MLREHGFTECSDELNNPEITRDSSYQLKVDELAAYIKENRININDLIECVKNDSNEVDPISFQNIMAVSSPEPLSFLRHVLDKNSLKNLGSTGKVYIQTTDELKHDSYKYKEILDKYGINVELIESGPLPFARKFGHVAIKKCIDSTFQINNTPGNPDLREAMKYVALQAGASVVAFSPYSNEIERIYGNSETANDNQLDVDWSRIGGLNGVLPMYDINMPTRVKPSEGRFTEYSPPKNKLELDVNEVIKSSDVELAGFGVEIVPVKNINREKEVDAICIHNGRLIAIEAKQVEINSETGGYDNLQKNLQELMRQLSIYDTKTNFIKKIGVLPESVDSMLKTIKNPAVRFSVNEEIKILKDMGVELVGLNELLDRLSNR